MMRILTKMTSWAGEKSGSGLWSSFLALDTRLGIGAFRKDRLSVLNDLQPRDNSHRDESDCTRQSTTAFYSPVINLPRWF